MKKHCMLVYCTLDVAAAVIGILALAAELPGLQDAFACTL